MQGLPSLLAAAGFRVSGHLVPGTTQRLFGGTGLLHVQDGAWTRKGSFAWEGAAVAGGLRSLYTKRKKKVQESSFKGVVRQEADFGKDVMKVLRRQQMVPARIQDHDGKKIYALLNEKILTRTLENKAMYNTVFTVELSELEPFKCIIRRMQTDPITDDVLHVELVKYVRGVGIEVDIPVICINEEKSPGVKKGGVVNQVLRTVTCICKEETIPTQVVADLTGLEIGERLWLHQIQMPPGLEIASRAHYKSCPALRIGRTRASMLEARKAAEEAKAAG